MSTRAKRDCKPTMIASMRARTLAAVASALLAGAAGAQQGPEQQFNAAVDLLRAGRSGDALSALESLTHKEPTFRLGQLFYGELLAALSGAKRGILIPEGPDA
ncbi:MAG: hypothetical protein HYZ32_00335, partial [Hydrocarboniphaga effusa]|nr:hypothetical protein [Hydrocarboniphaga effusa]